VRVFYAFKKRQNSKKTAVFDQKLVLFTPKIGILAQKAHFLFQSV
jgi:hypothetical protein